ncbi:MAG: PilZ domain-containing protein [Gammaproteobacteria bacterium]|nr:PilZ domain-containing protein [Gammaproteobacteria bacterium]MDP2141162.1 PilZ domain-containing protein [Gammaproteobacteria bacterium]MDP2349164.1 PilZ domain-containing protein [Gammaproteobacteria bacterium]
MIISENDNKSTKHGILSLTIKDKTVLHAAYMPFIKNGGLFIPTTKDYEIGHDVFILLKLMDDGERIPVAGTVVWITPRRAQGNRAAGIGIQFNDTDGNVRKKIETLLAGQLNSDKLTHTM